MTTVSYGVRSGRTTTGQSVIDVVEIADEDDQHCTICSGSSEQLVTLCLCQQGHCGGEEQCEHDQYANGIEGRVAVANTGKLVHCYHW